MRRLLVVLLAAVALGAPALAVWGCGDKTKVVTSTNANGQVTTETVPAVHFAKTKFLLHAGLAFGAFHRYILKPYRAHAFSKGANGRVKALAKAGAAALFSVHELKEADKAALSDDRLRPLAQKVTGLTSRLSTLGGSLKSGALSPAGIAGAASAVTALGRSSGGLGAAIKDRAVPGLS